MKKSLLLFASILMIFFFGTNAYAKKVLFLTNIAPTTNQSDLTIISYLQSNAFEVVVKKSQEFNASFDLDGVDCIFISEAISSGDPAALYVAENSGIITIPIINCEPYAYSANRLPWISNQAAYAKGLIEISKIWITANGAIHPIATKAGITAATTSDADAIVVLTKNEPEGTVLPKMGYIAMNDVTKGVIIGWNGIVGEGSTSKALLFAIEKGTEVVPGKILPARRVNFFIANSANNKLTEVGYKLLKASIEWGIEGKDYIPTGIIQGTEGIKFIYANNYFTFHNGNANLEIYTINGTLIKKVQNVKNFDCKGMAKGIYIGKVNMPGRFQSLKFVVN